MIRSRRGGLLTVLALAMPAVLAACGAPDETLSLGPNYPNAEVGPMIARSILLVAGPDGQDANVVMTLVNYGTEGDALREVRVSRADREGSRQASVNVRIQPGGTVSLGSPGQPSVVIRGIDQLAQPGEFVDLELLFDKAGSTKVVTLVHAGTGYYAAFTPTALPPPASPTGSPTASPTGLPSPSPNGTPSPSPSETGTPT